MDACPVQHGTLRWVDDGLYMPSPVDTGRYTVLSKVYSVVESP